MGEVLSKYSANALRARYLRCRQPYQFDPMGGTGILVERASWWNGHLAHFIPGQNVPTLATNKIRVSGFLTYPTPHLP
ncbi:MAG: hypothetical protein F6K55_47135 [Moorea sp. SIO4A3]|nr:hypothetical protein [Moorena sp. SIO4A3]